MIDELIWHKLEQLYLQNPEIKLPNATDRDIQDIQSSIRCMLGDFYRYFLKHHAVNKIASWSMCGADLSASYSIVGKTLSFRGNLDIPSEYRRWYLVASDEKGDLLLMNDRRELWSLNFMNNICDANKIAENFEQFLANHLTYS